MSTITLSAHTNTNKVEKTKEMCKKDLKHNLTMQKYIESFIEKTTNIAYIKGRPKSKSLAINTSN